MSLFLSGFTGSHPQSIVTHVEVTMFMLQVNKAAPPPQQSHRSVNTQLQLNSEPVEENGKGIWPHLINH